MKRILAWLFVMTSMLIMDSCEFEEVDLGFPKSITFTSNGGEKTITGDESFVFAETQDYSKHPIKYTKAMAATLSLEYAAIVVLW